MLVQRRQTCLRLFGEVDVFGEHEERVRLGGAAAHATLQLIHLRQAQTLRILDDERVRVRVVDAGLDDGGCHQHIELPGGKLLHHLLQRVLIHLPVRHAHARLPGCGLHASHRFLDGPDAVGDIVHLPASGKLAPDGGADHVGIPLSDVNLDGASIVGRREDEAHVAHARQRHLHGARDRRCRKREHVDALAKVLHLLLVAHAEALLLVNDHQAQVMGVHIARQQAMRAYQHIHAAVGEALERRSLLLRRTEAAEHLDGHAERLEAVLEVREMLLSQDGGRAQHHNLLLILRSGEGGAQRHLGFPEADVAAHQAIHGLGAAHIGLHVGDGRQLIGGFPIRERLLHLDLRRRVGSERVPLRAGAARVHVHQIERKLFGGRARLLHGARPVGRVQAGASRRGALGADVARDAVELLDRHEQLVAFGVFQQQVIACRAVDLATHQLLEVRDAVLRVHNVIARLIRERDLGDVDMTARTRSGGPLGVGHADHAQLRLRDDHSQRDVHVDDVDDPAAQAALLLPVGVIRVFLGIKPFLNGKAVIDEGEHHIGTASAVRGAEHHRIAIVDQCAQAAEQLIGVPRRLDALHRQLDIHVAANAHDGHVRCTLALAEADLRSRAEQPLKGDVGALGLRFQLLAGVHHVIEQASRLDKHRKRVTAQIGAERDRLIIEVGQQHIASLEAQSALSVLQMFGNAAQRGVGSRQRRKLLACARQTRFAARELDNGIDIDVLQA